jgi:hypothetical protein
VEQLAAAAESQPVRLLPMARIEALELPGEHTVGDLAKSIAELQRVIRPANPRRAGRLSENDPLSDTLLNDVEEMREVHRFLNDLGRSKHPPLLMGILDCGDHDDGNARELAVLEALLCVSELMAVHPRHTEVQQDHGRAVMCERR